MTTPHKSAVNRHMQHMAHIESRNLGQPKAVAKLASRPDTKKQAAKDAATIATITGPPKTPHP